MLEVTVWANPMQGQDGSTWTQYAITMAKSYKGQDGKWHPASSYRQHELPVLYFLLRRAHDWCLSQRMEDSTIPF
jgi:hypothetical protein